MSHSRLPWRGRRELAVPPNTGSIYCGAAGTGARPFDL